MVIVPFSPPRAGNAWFRVILLSFGVGVNPHDRRGLDAVDKIRGRERSAQEETAGRRRAGGGQEAEHAYEKNCIRGIRRYRCANSRKIGTNRARFKEKNSEMV